MQTQPLTNKIGMQTQSLTNKIGKQKISVYTITYAHDRNAKDECKHNHLRTR